jgi:hypothetical protein
MPADSRFDLDLRFGQEGEKWLTLLADEKTMEVKRERDIWSLTGNVFFEFKSRGKASGLAVTQADYWAHLLSLDGRIVGGFIIETSRLKENLKRMIEGGQVRVVNGGDNGTSQGALVPMSLMRELFS